MNKDEWNKMVSALDEECKYVLSSLTPEQDATFKDLLNKGNIIYATKYLAEQTKCGLIIAKTACDYVNELKDKEHETIK